MQSTQTGLDTASPVFLDDRYADFASGVRTVFAGHLARSPHLFTTDATGLWDLYLDKAPEGRRQDRNCHACRHFIERFGALVTIMPDGLTVPALWPIDAPPMYRSASHALAQRVAKADVTGVFRSSVADLGVAVTGPWSHLALTLPKALLWTGVVTNASQEMAEKKQEYEMLLRGLDDFPIDVVRKAHTFLTSGALFRSEKCEGVAKWLLDLHERRATTKVPKFRERITWLAIAGAPKGFAHVRSGMIGTLLEDIVADIPFGTLKERFDSKMNPLQYQRPQAAPSAGNIAQAEKIVGALRSARALERRFAKLADVQALWTPKAAPEIAKPGGVFGHLVPRADATPIISTAPPTVMTWSKFAATVLPTAEAIEFQIPHGRSAYAAMVTAKDPEAPPIMQWDRPERRNPVSYYVYTSGSMPEQWGLRAGQPHRVTAVVLQPSLWDPSASFSHFGASVMFVLEGAFDTTYERGAGMFPELLKSEYHGVRSTLEAHFRGAAIEGKREAEVCGIYLTRNAPWNMTFRVTSRGVRSNYMLDRWD